MNGSMNGASEVDDDYEWIYEWMTNYESVELLKNRGGKNFAV